MSDFDSPGGDAFVVPLNGSAASAVDVTENLPATVTSLAWGCEPGRLVASTLQAENLEITEIETAPPRRRTIWHGQNALTGSDTAVSFQCKSGTSATIRESFTEPPEIVVGPLGQWHALTTANAGVTAPVQVRNISWTSEGDAMQGWLLLPAGASADARLPTITAVHGGPAWAYQPYLFEPGFTRALVEHGYALFLPNPRGSFGQGKSFTRANVRDFGHGDLRDILTGIDAAAALAPIDTARLGITGVSYGGFMTMWAVTQTERFKAAVARAGISDWTSYYGENGIGGWLLPYFGASLYDDPNIYARSSPIGAVTHVRTPTLLLVGERDIECPPPQSQEFWHALQELRVPTGFVVYPDEGHELREPKNVSDATGRAIGWFDRYLR